MVLLNYPRTGSTWTRSVLRRLHGADGGTLARKLAGTRIGWRGFHELILPIDRTSTALRERRRSQHGSYRQIPNWARGRPLVSLGRAPLEQLSSAYHHGFWRTHPPGGLDRVRELFPSFPELSLAEYIGFLERLALPDVLQGLRPRAAIGPLTVHFLRFFHPDPDAALTDWSDADIDEGRHRDELPTVRFLRTERLRRDLLELLVEQGYPRAAVETAMEDAPRNASRRSSGARVAGSAVEGLGDEERTRLLYRERLLDRMFPPVEDGD